MGKCSLKLFNSGSKVKIIDIKKQDVVLLDAIVELKNNKICISYNKDELNKCGFVNIEKVEIYKDSHLVCHDDRISNYYIEFPYFSSNGIYEIKTLISNQDRDLNKTIVSSFEFFNYRVDVRCDNFKLNIYQLLSDIVINFDKRFGNLDLSEIILPNITLIDSKNNEIKNIPCKIQTKLNSIDFIILDVFKDDIRKSIVPNEIYTFKISIRGNDIYSSFSFEYENLDIYINHIIGDLKFEFLQKSSKCFFSVKVFIKLNELINIDDYQFNISNIRSKFLHFIAKENGVKDTLVFECVFPSQKGYFEFNIFKDDFLHTIVIDYDFSSDMPYIIDRKIPLATVKRERNKYSLLFNGLDFYLDENSEIYFNKLSDKKNYFNKGNIFSNENNCLDVLFNDIVISNKCNEIYVLEIEDNFKFGFVLSRSIGVKFKQIGYESKFDNTKIDLSFLNKDQQLIGKSVFKNGREENFKAEEGYSEFRVHSKFDDEFIYLKFYDENNKIFSETISLYREEKDPYVNKYSLEKVSLDSSNNLHITSKNIFDDFGEKFDVLILSESGIILQKFNILKKSGFKIYFEEFNLENNFVYYVKLKKDDKYKIYSFYTLDIDKGCNLFVNNIDNLGVNISIVNLNNFNRKHLRIKLFMLVDGLKYSFINQHLNISDDNMRIDFLDNTLIENTNYIMVFYFNGIKTRVYFTYLGNKYLDTLEDDTYELAEFLLSEQEELYSNDLYDLSFRKDTPDSNNKEVEVSLEDLDIIIKKAYDIFLNFNISRNHREFVFWKKLIKDNKVGLKYFIEMFVTEHLLGFKEEFMENETYDELFKIILKFLNIDDDQFKSVRFSDVDYDTFLNESLDMVSTTNDYKNMEHIFVKNNEL